MPHILRHWVDAGRPSAMKGRFQESRPSCAVIVGRAETGFDGRRRAAPEGAALATVLQIPALERFYCVMWNASDVMTARS